MIRKLIMVALAAAALVTFRAPAAAQVVAGTWTVEFPARIENHNGEETVTMGKARLTLQVKGDSVSGTWLVLDRPNPRPREIHGTFRGGTIKFSLTTEGRINQNGEERTVKMTTDYTAAVAGNEMKGTLQSHGEGGMDSPERKWSAKRDS